MIGNLNQPASQIWEQDFDTFMTTKYGNPIARHQSSSNWTEQFLDGKKMPFAFLRNILFKIYHYIKSIAKLSLNQ